MESCRGETATSAGFLRLAFTASLSLASRDQYLFYAECDRHRATREDKLKLTRFSRVVVPMIIMQCIVPVFGQELTKTPHSREAQLPSTTPHINVYQILDHARRLSQEARGMEPREDEIRLQAGLADSVWNIDQSLGKRFLWRSFNLTVISLREQSSPTNARASTIDPNLLFHQISSIAARHDPKLERQLTESWQNNIDAILSKEEKPKSDPAQVSSLLLSQSARFLKDHVQKSRQLFRESVSLRVLPEHCYFLMNQRTHDVAISDGFFSDALAVLAQRPIAEANELLVLSSYLFSPDNSIAYLAISGYNTANGAGNVSAAPKNTALAKQYLVLLLAKLDAGESIPWEVAYFGLKNLTAQYAAIAPEHLQDLYAKLGTLGTSVSNSNTTAYESARDDFTASDTDTIAGWEKRLRLAEKIEDAGRRDLEYFTIIIGHLLPKRDFTQAARLASRIYNDELRRTLVDLVSLRSIQSGLKQSEVSSPPSGDDWEKIYASIKDPLLKVVALSSVAQAQIEKKSTADAIRLLDQASEEAQRISSDQDRLQLQLMLTQLYLSADSARGFGAAVLVFKAINKLPDFNFRRSSVVVRATVYAFTNQLPIELPTSSSLTSTVGKMCRVNCMEALESCRVLEDKKIKLWAMFEAVRTAILESERTKKVATLKVSPD